MYRKNESELNVSSADGYDEAMPEVREYVAAYQRALERVRASHHGRPMGEVRRALLEEFEAEGLQVWSEVVTDAARIIAGDAD
ncbi:hypothetical protein [Streptomyces sp. NPDC093105]|uniref:hypothetical protein n=1 Tax=Streptomyces sp. NPDC093105 TaxID=3366029 RepID=UPI00380A49C0